jgi:hypothetical protein
MTVQIGCVQDRDANGVGFNRGSGTSERRACTEQSGLARELQKISPCPESIRMQHRLTFELPDTSHVPALTSMKMLRLAMLTA